MLRVFQGSFHVIIHSNPMEVLLPSPYFANKETEVKEMYVVGLRSQLLSGKGSI